MKYTREQLVEMGMDEAQIGAILATYASEDNGKVVAMQQEPVVVGPGEAVPVNCDEPMNVTSLADLQSYAAGTVVRFPDFAEGQPFVAKVRRPSLLMLAKQGKIPNTLLNAASDLFAKGGGGLNPKDENMLGDMYDIMRIICSSSLIQPSVQDIEQAGLQLSDDQLMAIFNYSQTGVRALESFRKDQGSSQRNSTI